MNRALWLLLRLRLVAWLRRLGRALTTVRGILLAVLGALVFVPWLLMWLFVPPSTVAGLAAQHLADARRFGPPGLALYCVIELLMSADRAITFTAAEVNFLFPGPLSRRQLLLYKVLIMFGGALLSTAFMTLFLRQYAALTVAAVVGLLLTMMFVQLFPMALSLLAGAVGVRAYNRQRKAVLLVLAVLAAVAVAQAAGSVVGREPADVLSEIENSAVAQTLLAPFRWFVDAFTAEYVWPDLVQYAGLGLLVDLLLIVVIFALDAQYLEASAAASERNYERVQRLKRGGATLAGLAPSGKARVTLPALPWWGGIGPIAWRQLLTALRSPRSLLTVLVVLAVMAAPALATNRRPGDQGDTTGVAIAVLLALTLFVPPLLPFDFRGDVDRMDMLKALPLPAWRLTVGQLVTPVLLVTAIQLVLAGVLIAVRGQVEPLLLAAAAFFVPVNWMLFAVENMLFLWFPTRQLAAPGDMQALGRQMLVWIVKLLLLQLVALFAGVAGLLAYLLAGNSWLAGGIVAWVVLTGFAVGVVPLVALAFRGFDVAADTP